MSNVLIDRHQADLFYSLQLLFEDRLGHTVYTPIGFDWFDAGVWQFGHQHFGRSLAEQFLRIDARWSDDLTSRDTHHPDRLIRGVTWDQARQMDWAYVVATVPDNQTGFHAFSMDHGAKYVLQVGNTNQYVDWGLDPLALVSSEVPIAGRGIRYHQEFDSQGTFGYRAPIAKSRVRVATFVNCYSSMSGTYPQWLQAKELAPDFIWREHGIDGVDGNLEPVSAIADQMAVADFGWHSKEQGDGFGHVIHNWAAIGRPLVGQAHRYRGRLAEPLWVDGETCIDLDQHPVPEAIGMMREIVADPARHRAMCKAIRAKFDSLVDYAAEAEQIRAFLA